MENDLALLERYRHSRDADAFALLADRYAGMVYGVALRVTGNVHDAEEVAQECFLTLARQAGSVRSSLPGWLHCLAMSRAKDFVRGNRRRQQREAASEVQTLIATPDAPWQQIAGHVDEAIEELPRDLREAVVGRYLEGRTQADLAERWGVNRSTASRRIEKAVEFLRKRLGTKGVAVLAGTLMSLLATEAAQAAPASLKAGLGKMAAAGIGGASTAGGATLLVKTGIAATVTVCALTATAVVVWPRATPPVVAPPVAVVPTTIEAIPTTKAATTALPAGAAPNRAKGSLSGTVFLPDGRPAGGFVLIPYVKDAEFPDVSSSRGSVSRASERERFTLHYDSGRSVQAGEDGAFRIERLAPGSYGLIASPRTWQAGVRHLVHPERGEPFFARQGAVEVKFVGRERTMETGAAGPEWVKPDYAQYATSMTGEFEVRPGEDTVAPAIRLEVGGVIAGRLTDSDTGAPLAGADISYNSYGRTDKGYFGEIFPLHLLTDADGTYRFEGLPPGEYQVRALLAGYRAAPGTDGRPFRVENGQTVTHDMSLKR